MKVSKIKNKKAIMALAFLFGLSFGFSMTWSYSMDSASIANEFNLDEWQTLFAEEFNSPSNWITCENIEKTVTATNKTGMALGVRMKLEESWTAKDGRELPLVSATSGNRMAIIQYSDNGDWTEIDDEGYVYYDGNLVDNGTTSSPITGVTLNCLANLSLDADYADATYHLKVTAQAIDAYEKESVWGI
jgi:alternate signal-mediated exported protein